MKILAIAVNGDSHNSGKLTDLGIEQIEKVKKHLLPYLGKSETAVYCSHKRAASSSAFLLQALLVNASELPLGSLGSDQSPRADVVSVYTDVVEGNNRESVVVLSDYQNVRNLVGEISRQILGRSIPVELEAGELVIFDLENQSLLFIP